MNTVLSFMLWLFMWVTVGVSIQLFVMFYPDHYLSTVEILVPFCMLVGVLLYLIHKYLEQL